MSAVIWSVSSSVKGPSVQSGRARMNSAQPFHRVPYGVKVLAIFARFGYSVSGISKIVSRDWYTSASSWASFSFCSMSVTYASRSSTCSISPYVMNVSTSVSIVSISSMSFCTSFFRSSWKRARLRAMFISPSEMTSTSFMGQYDVSQYLVLSSSFMG